MKKTSPYLPSIWMYSWDTPTPGIGMTSSLWLDHVLVFLATGYLYQRSKLESKSTGTAPFYVTCGTCSMNDFTPHLSLLQVPTYAMGPKCALFFFAHVLHCGECRCAWGIRLLSMEQFHYIINGPFEWDNIEETKWGEKVKFLASNPFHLFPKPPI